MGGLPTQIGENFSRPQGPTCTWTWSRRRNRAPTRPSGRWKTRPGGRSETSSGCRSSCLRPPHRSPACASQPTGHLRAGGAAVRPAPRIDADQLERERHGQEPVLLRGAERGVRRRRAERQPAADAWRGSGHSHPRVAGGADERAVARPADSGERDSAACRCSMHPGLQATAAGQCAEFRGGRRPTARAGLPSPGSVCRAWRRTARTSLAASGTVPGFRAR